MVKWVLCLASGHGIGPSHLRKSPGIPWSTGHFNGKKMNKHIYISHRVHGAGIYANIGGIVMGSMLPYMAYMDPMGMEG